MLNYMALRPSRREGRRAIVTMGENEN